MDDADNVDRNDEREAGEERVLVVYGHDYCSQAWSLRDRLEEHGVQFEWRDIIQGKPQYKDDLRALARGYLSVPTVIFPDGTVWVEPPTDRVLDRLGIQRPGPGGRIRDWIGM